MLNRYLIPFCAFMILIGFLWRGLYVDYKTIPQFELTTLNNSVVTEKIFLDKISVLHVWSSWCKACVIEHEFLDNLQNTDEFQLVGINYKDIQKNADLWLNKYGNPYRVILLDREGSFSMSLGVYGTPTTFIVDRDGIIRYRHVGVLTKDIWSSKISPVIQKIKLV